MNNSLEIDQLNVSFGKINILWDISLSLPKGKIIALMGPNGAGKTTLLKSILGLVKPISGNIRIYGKAKEEMISHISYIPQSSEIDWDFPITVMRFVLMGCYGRLGFFKRPKRKERHEALKNLQVVGLSEFAGRQIGQLSKGQQQRLFIARALMQDPKIFLLDEPFAGVDVTTERNMISLFKKFKDEGKTILLIHHDIYRAREYFDWIIFLNTNLIDYGKVSNVFNLKNISRTFGKDHVFFKEITKLSEEKTSGKYGI